MTLLLFKNCSVSHSYNGKLFFQAVVINVYSEKTSIKYI